ncbi:MAG: hypothetical protein ACKOHG_09150 [Planctomycetia bacterium]
MNFSASENPYAAPETSLVTDAGGLIVAGGTLEDTLAGRTHWTIGEILGDSWKLVRGFKGTFWLAFLAYLGITIAGGFLVQVVFTITRSPVVAQLLNFILMVAVYYPMFAGLMMLGVRRAAGATTRASLVGECLPKAGRIAGLYVMQMLLIGLGFVALILPGIYLSVAYMIALPLAVDRDMRIWTALETSRRAIGTCWFRTAGLLTVLSLSGFVMLFTAGIAAIWLAPLAIIAWGMLYHRLVGYSGEGAA